MRSAGALKNVQVLGIGHLAAAVRVQLRGALSAFEADFENDSSETLLLACSDFPNTASFRDANARTLAAGGRILFAALMPEALRLGPLVEPGRAGCFECVAARLHGLAAARLRKTPGAGGAPDPIRGARIGATLVVRVILASRATPYRGTPDRRAGGAGCPSCSGRAWRAVFARISGF
jgi:hypothetical protein